MKRTKNMIYKASDEARELFLYATNSGVLYDRQIKPSIENLRKKARKGTFDKDKAADLFYYVATSASAMYDKEILDLAFLSSSALQPRLIWLIFTLMK